MFDKLFLSVLSINVVAWAAAATDHETVSGDGPLWLLLVLNFSVAAAIVVRLWLNRSPQA